MGTNKILLLLLTGTSVCGASAQDAHFSQYEAATVLLNPALTGMFEHSDFRMNCNLRHQWSRLPNSFLTTAFAYDAAFKNRYGAGMYLSNYDMAGVLKTLEFGLAGSYNVSQKNAKHTLSVGLRAGAIYKKVNDDDLLYDQQYDDGFFNPDLPTGETFQRRARWMPDLALGLAYRSIDAQRLLNPYAGFSAFHLTTPDESIFRTEKSDLPIRWSVNGGVVVTVNSGLRLTPMGLLMMQGKNREINAGFMGDLAIGGSAYSVLFGGSYRVRDAVIGHLGWKHRNNVYRISYDMTVSPLGAYNNRLGAIEFSIMYYGTHSGRDRRARAVMM